MPRYKVKAEGDIVRVYALKLVCSNHSLCTLLSPKLLIQVQQDDQIVLESLKSPGQFLHISASFFGAASVYQGSYVHSTSGCILCVGI